MKSKVKLKKLQTCNTKLLTYKQRDKYIENTLYQYPMWKVNLNFCGYLDEEINNGCDEVKSETDPWPAKKRGDYQKKADLVDAVVSSLTTVEQEFIRHRYFKRMPFKIIAEELAVVERHLYRIRRKVIHQFAIALGWDK